MLLARLAGKILFNKIIYTPLSVEVRCTALAAGYRGEFQEVPAGIPYGRYRTVVYGVYNKATLPLSF